MLGGLYINEKCDDLWKIYNSINSWIKLSDTKATALLAINGVILTIIFSSVPKLVSFIDLQTIKILITGILIGSLSSTISLLFSVLCLIPRVSSDKSQKSVIFFGDISKNYNDSKSYADSATEILFKDRKLKDQILSEIWINSKIASAKYFNVKYAIIFLIGTIFCLIIPLILIFSF